jgi:tRNA threonylcarbamoyl adenosine modification protein (Sua5/YciO/YrdC/YwlC family)
MLLAIVSSTSRSFSLQSLLPTYLTRRKFFRSKLCHSMSAIHGNGKSFATNVRAKRVTLQDLDACGGRLRRGDLVSFPTETVYGLGCHALDELACRKVFAAKERPLTDPLIVHVNEEAKAQELWQATADSLEGRILACLIHEFWPGPLTLVAKATSSVPSVLMAGTGFVACRSPSHPTARALIASAGVPIAAPSANKFGHVSPTCADHVFDDLRYEDVWIVEEDEPLQVGVESSVAKLEMQDKARGVLTVLRQGAISVLDLQRCLRKANIDSVQVRANTSRSTSDEEANVAPGQTVRHYSPNIPSFLVSKYCVESYMNDGNQSKLADTVIVDYGETMLSWKEYCAAYRDLSSVADSTKAAQAVFDTLRWAEQVEGASRVLFPDLEVDDESDALILAVKDKLTRAASGVVLESLS